MASSRLKRYNETNTRERIFIQALKLVHPVHTFARTKAGVDFRLNGALLSVRFQIQSEVPFHINPGLSLDSPQWGLWDWDVVEVFVACDGKTSRSPYYEFQVSPLGQNFELEIMEPRKRFNREFRSGFTHSADRSTEGNWEAQLDIPLERLGWDGHPASIMGGAFAILGPPHVRSYWSLFLEPQKTPDFHLPTEFRRLIV